MTHTTRLALTLSLALAACGDDITDHGDVPDASPGADAAIDADASPAAGPRAIVVGGDYAETGTMSGIDVDSLEVETNLVAGVVAGDPALRHIGDRLYVINRSTSNVTILDEDLTLITQVSTGAGSNPQDIAVVGDSLYVAAFAASGVLVFSSSGDTREIDLSSLDEDGVPNCNSLHLVGDDLYVTCSVLDEGFAPRGPGVVAVIDTTDDTLSTTLELVHENPMGGLMPYGDDLVIATVPSFADLTQGCLERIVPGDEPSAGTCVVDNEALGGYAAGVHESDDKLFIAVAESFTAGRVTVLDDDGLRDGSLVPAGSIPTDLTVCPDGSVLVADNAADARGVRVLAADGTERTTEPLDVAWPEVFAPLNAMACL